MATGMPFSSRPSLVMTQTCLLLVSGPLPQTFIHGEYINCGSPACAGAAAGAASAGLAAGDCFGAAGLAGCFGGVWANAGAATSNAASKPAAVSVRPSGRADAIR